MGGIINMESDAMCPEDIQTPWSFYRWGDGEVNDWEEDPFLKVTCGGELPRTTTPKTTVKTTSTTERPGPQPEPCTWGSACDGCEVSMTLPHVPPPHHHHVSGDHGGGGPGLLLRRPVRLGRGLGLG